MSNYATKQDVQEIVGKAIDRALTDLSGIIGDFAQQVDTRFNQNEAAVHSLAVRLDKVENRLDEIDKKFDHLLATLDSFLARIDHYEVEQQMRDSQFERLLA